MRFHRREGLLLRIAAVSPAERGPARAPCRLRPVSAFRSTERAMMVGMDARSGLRVRAEGREDDFAPGRDVTVGRSQSADVVLDDPLVSSMHARLLSGPEGWTVEDAGSVHGIWLNGARVGRATITGRTTVFLGPPATSSRIDLSLVPLDRGTVQTGPSEVVASEHPPKVVADPVSPSPVPALRLRFSGRGYRFPPERTVLVGRGAAPAGTSNDQSEASRIPDVTTDNPLVSRAHLILSPTPQGWRLIDQSLRGTFVGGRRVRELLVQTPMVARLGDPAAGEELTLVPDLAPERLVAIEEHSSRRQRVRRVAPLLAVLAALLVAAGLGGALLAPQRVKSVQTPPARVPPASSAETPPVAPAPTVSPSSGPARSLGELERATVLLTAQAQLPGGRIARWSGSGSVITADGLILTNAHVAAPAALGDVRLYGSDRLPNPRYLVVHLVTGDADPAQPTYRARTVAVDGALDLAVLRLDATADGSPLPTELTLPTVPLGDSDSLAVGDDLRVLGFPGISDTESITVTKGSVASIVPDADLQIDRGYIDTDARISPGNSGGLAANEAAELMGVPTLLRRDDSGPVVSGRLRPIALAKPLIEAAKSNARYTSPYQKGAKK